LTNILRDSAEDYTVSGRIYLPADELAQFGVTPGEWARAKPSGWDELMRFQVSRARAHFAAADASLPASQRRVMVAAEIMRNVYGTLLDRMEADGFRVWEQSYRLSGRRKAWLAASVFAKTVLSTAGATETPWKKLPYVERVR